MSWKLETLLWPLEQLVRQYVGYNESVTQEYNNIIEYNDLENCLRDKRSEMHWIIAQWRFSSSSEFVKCNPYIYQFRFVFNKDFNDYDRNKIYPWLCERISKGHHFYKDNVKIGVPVGRVI